jgi:hypothetical protein
MEMYKELVARKCEFNYNKQPREYSQKELDHLKKFVKLVQNDDKRSQIACWGNHSDYAHGY